MLPFYFCICLKFLEHNLIMVNPIAVAVSGIDIICIITLFPSSSLQWHEHYLGETRVMPCAISPTV